MKPEPYFAQTMPPLHAEEHLTRYCLDQQRKLGRITQSGEPITPVSEYSDLDPSVRRLVDYLYEHDELVIDINAIRHNYSAVGLIQPDAADPSRSLGSPNLKQLWVDINWLKDHGIIDVVIHKGKRVAFLTARGERLVDDQ